MGQQHSMRAIPRILVLAAFLLALLPSPLMLAQGTAVFSRVDVAGNIRIEADTIRVFAGIQPGTAVTPEDLNLAVRRLYESGLFEDVEVMPQAGRLVITVAENPTINQIAFEGNKALKSEDLIGVVELRPRVAYSVSAAEADAQRIIDAYRSSGRYAAQVKPVIIRRSDNRVDLVFEVHEGRVTAVQRINFTGNQIYSDRRLRRVVESNQTNLLSFLLGGVNYDADKLELDRELLRQFYLERGYVDVRVLSSTAEISRERNAFFLSFTISEGERYDFGKASVSSSTPGLNAADFRPLLSELRAGDVYNVRKVERVIERMTFQAGQEGYAFVQVLPEITKNKAGRTVDINFRLVEGERVFIERIDIQGNSRTLDRVVRRQFHVVEGDAFNAREIKDAEDRINGLGYFESAVVDVRPGAVPGRVLVGVDVEEAPTGSLNLGGAFSSSEGLTAQVSLVERNFLGRGQTLSGAISASKENQNFEFGFIEPAMFDRDLLAGFNIFVRNTNFSEQSFKTKNVGFEPRVGFPLSENGRLDIRYKISSDDIFDLLPTTSRIIFDEQGELLTSAVVFNYIYDRRNSAIDPSAGFVLTLDQEFAGLGGDVFHTKTRGTARVYKSFFEEALILSATAEGGYIYSKDGTRITDRFNAGGDSFRGFARNGIGPRDVCDVGDCRNPQEFQEVDESVGGNAYSILRLDASFPLGLPQEYGIYGGVFADVGSLWSLDNTDGSMGAVDDQLHLRSSIGVSLFVETPFAPLRFNFSRPLRKQDTDVVENFRFTVQTRF